MTRTALVAAASASLLAAGCSAYQPPSLYYTAFGPAAVRDRVMIDPSLSERYPRARATSDMSFPEGSAAPPRRDAARAWEPAAASAPLDAEAERRSIARDLPHASVTPWGAAGPR